MPFSTSLVLCSRKSGNTKERLSFVYYTANCYSVSILIQKPRPHLMEFSCHYYWSKVCGYLRVAHCLPAQSYRDSGEDRPSGQKFNFYDFQSVLSRNTSLLSTEPFMRRVVSQSMAWRLNIVLHLFRMTSICRISVH